MEFKLQNAGMAFTDIYKPIWRFNWQCKGYALAKLTL